MTMTVLTGPGEEAVAANKASWVGVGPQDSTPDDKKIHQLATTSFLFEPCHQALQLEGAHGVQLHIELFVSPEISLLEIQTMNLMW